MSLSRSTGTGSTVAPSGCRWCGIEARGHGRQHVVGVGWHVWTAPTLQQRKERMLQRRAVRPVRKPGPGGR
ncbi:hypothetical protein B1H29_37005 [Streptomyces pactum]|uniref:Uncharacterized protein n=1 Tax=Streptomyces pactum TaxID=68249 RepID=A0A1S6J1D2_9ACTN|nr:hypothetical protein B1H29_00040 [Streptomyces pactum]AQS71689.1 hypothetical protein B1H29_37005 [Streptomyces pactum]